MAHLRSGERTRHRVLQSSPSPIDPSSFGSWKQRMWAELHQHAAFSSSLDVGSRSAGLGVGRFLHAFQRRIPCPHCRRHWLAIVRNHPPDLTSRYTYFRWTVRAHNAINAMLRKPIMKFQDACRLWGFSGSVRTGDNEGNEG